MLGGKLKRWKAAAGPVGRLVERLRGWMAGGATKMSLSTLSGNPARPALPVAGARDGAACRGCAAREACTAHARRFLRGYEIPRRARERLPQWRRTSLAVSVATALADMSAIHLLMAAHLVLVLYGPAWLAAQAYLAVLLVIARNLRGLEVLVHEGSHYNLTRRKRLNDGVVNGLAAFPVFQTVEGFRVEHARHHIQLGGEHDPCRQRFIDLEWGKLSRASALAYARGMIGRLPQYSASWWKLIGSNRRVVVRAAVWHLAVFVAPLAAAFSLRPGGAGAGWSVAWALLAWAAYVGVAFVAVLPPLRFIAEAAKHDYDHGSTTKTGTFSNIGPVHWILHPHGDGYHFLHHVDPSIPHHRLRAVHEWLTGNDPEYASSRQRTHVLEEVPLPPADVREVAA